MKREMRATVLWLAVFAPLILHVVVDLLIGIGAGVAVVVVYLAVLRWLDRNRGPDENGATHSTDQRRQGR